MKTSKKLAFSSILTALCFILMLIGSFFGSLDLTSAALASFCIIIAVAEMGYGNAALIYAAASVLAFLLLPSKSPALLFAAFLGYYPIVKSLSEKLSGLYSYLIKFVSFAAAFWVIYFIVIKFATVDPELQRLFIPALLIPAFLIAALVFLIYDFALTRIISLYCRSLRSRLGINKLFK